MSSKPNGPSVSPSDPEKLATARLERANRLYVVLFELEEKRAAIIEEMGRILSGKPATNDYVKAVMTAFNIAWAKRYKSNYAWRMTEDVPNVKRLLKVLGENLESATSELYTRMHNYLRSDDPFYRQARHNFGVFVRSINDLADEALPFTGDSEPGSAPVGCRHAPPCRTDDEHTRKKSAEMRA